MTDRHTHTPTDRQTHTHTHTKFFIAFSCSGTSITSRKVIKSGGTKILFFAWIQYFGILMRAEVKVTFLSRMSCFCFRAQVSVHHIKFTEIYKADLKARFLENALKLGHRIFFCMNSIIWHSNASRRRNS
jgi:hypothetical protein